MGVRQARTYGTSCRSVAATGPGSSISPIRTLCRAPIPLATSTLPRPVSVSMNPLVSEIELTRPHSGSIE